MKIQQELDAAKGEYEKNKATLDHWTGEHEKLQLEDVE